MSLLAVENLHVHFLLRDRADELRIARALNGVSLAVSAREVLGLVGETGAGKSLTALAVMGLLRAPAKRVAGRIAFDGVELTALDQAALNAIRGNRIGMIVQSPKTSLDPVTRIGAQLVRAHLAHRRASRAAARARAEAMLAAVEIPDPARRMLAWPHELSGGMAQRVLMALALINDPDLVIADEPTTGLDVTVQAQVLDLLRAKIRERDRAAIIITHDLGVVAQYCDSVAVMFAGTIVESGAVDRVLTAPRHPYSARLVASAPDRIEIGRGVVRSGAPPDLFNLPPGCPYQDRCPRAAAICAGDLPMRELGAGHVVRCHFPEGA
jgi:peptide/nickel transport system ATP-binding protein/oligopeptide transport system ATP-binding protein